MSQLMAMMYALIDDVNKSEELSEIWHQSLPQVSLRGLDASRYLDGLAQAKDTDPLETLIKYLSDRREYLPN